MMNPMNPGPPAGGGRYAEAQSSLKSAGATLKILRFALAGLGALLVVAGLVMVFAVDISAGSGMLVTGLVLGVTGWFTLPKFMGQLGGASAMVDALHAKEQLALTGTPMTARLVSAQQTGAMINMSPQVHAVVEVYGPQGAYQVQTMTVVPQMSIPRFQPGATIQVRVNPMNPHDVAVVF